MIFILKIIPFKEYHMSCMFMSACNLENVFFWHEIATKIFLWYEYDNISKYKKTKMMAMIFGVLKNET